MDFWILYVCISFLCAIMALFFKDAHIKYISYAYIIYIWAVSAFRYMIGVDYYQYCVIWNNWNINKEFVFFEGHEPIFDIIVHGLKIGNFEFQSLFLVYATITIYLFYKAVSYYFASNYEILLSLIVYALNLDGLWFSMNGIRQALAMSVMLYVSRYVVEKKKLKFFLGVFLACLCHYSSILFVFLYFIPTKRLKIKYMLIIFLLGAFWAVFGGVDKIIEIMAGVLIGDNDILGKYMRYLGDDSRILIAPYYNAFIVFLYALFIQNISNEKWHYMLNVSVIYILFFYLFNMGELIRIRQGIALFFIMLNASMINVVLKKYKNYLIVALMIMLLSVNYIYRLNDYSGKTGMSLSDGNIEYRSNFELY